MVRRHRLLAILILAATYYGAARLGLSLASLPGNVSPVWPPTGLAIASLVLWGLDLAPFVFLGAFAANFFSPVPHLAALGMAAGNTLEAVIAAYAFRRSTGLSGPSARTSQILRVTTIGAGLATSLSATSGIASLIASGAMPASQWWSAWRVWWIGDALGALVVGGFMLVWARERRHPKGGPAEAALLLAGTVVTSVLIFSSDVALPYLLFPFVIWASLRYFWRGATATTLVIAAIAAVFTAHGEGHFAHDVSTDGLWTLDVYLAVLAITGLVLATVVAERDNAMARASQLSERLQQQVDDLRYQQSLRDAQRLSKVGFWRINVKTRELEWSDVMYELYGLDPATFSPTLDAFFDLVHPDDAEVTRTAILEALTTGATWTGDLRIVHSSGETRVLWGEAEAERNEAGELVSLRGVRQDVTELRLTAERLREAEEAAQRASQMKSQFLANMSHEIRTPLNGVVGMAELLADSPLSPAQREHVVALRSAADGLLGLLNDILDLARVEAGKIVLDATQFNVADIVRETATLFIPMANTKGIELRCDVGDLDCWVLGDPTRVRQVLTNLVGNAVKFTERGNVRISVRRDEGGVRFDVIDTGIGIPCDLQARLMTPFEQGDPSNTRRYGGSGLGLAISSELVVLMGGTITVASEVGVGTTMTVRVPLPVVDGPTPSKALPRGDLEALKGSIGRVLLAEDNVINQRVAVAMLEKLGWYVVVVDNGQAAVEQAAINEFDVVILDCQMPILDGYEAAQAIRRLPGRHGEVHIVAMTASAYAEDRERCLAAGMNDYLSKPVTRAEMVDALNRAVAVPG